MSYLNTIDTTYHTTNEHFEKFRGDMQLHGLTYRDELIADGKIHRFGQPDDKSDKPCWYVLHIDNIPAGAYGCFKRDIDETWCSRDINTLSVAEREEYLRKSAERKKIVTLEKVKLQQQAAIQCQQKLITAQEANPQHPYLLAKQIPVTGIKQSGNTLIIPLRDENGFVVNIQYIYVDEAGKYQKRFAKYAQKQGCFYVLGKLTQRIWIGEGVATCITLHLAANECVIIAFDSGNLKPVSENIKLLFPSSEIIIAGDNDHANKENTGLKKASEAALSIGCKFVIPEFSTGSMGTDFNDLMIEKGIDEVKQQLLRASNKKPFPLPDSRPEVLPLTKEMLPDAIRDYIFDVAERQQSLPDFVAVAAIIGLSGLLGQKAVIHPKQLDDWAVTPNQWGAIIGRPSAMKSPSMKEALKPLRLIDIKAAQQFEKDEQNFEEESQLIELEKLDAKKKAKAALKNKNRQEAKEALKTNENTQPVRKRLIVNDPTVEKLGELLNENPNGLILVRDEL